jgi:hypothetical protein
LNEAVRAFERVHGAPPEALEELVPRYLAEVPVTGMEAYPDDAYSRSVYADYNAEWSLSVSVSSGAINWALIIYFPSEQYPSHVWGEPVEQIGRWGYVRE